jgi:nitrate/TMAO reductase-like tetraheme cytochrome c subunit
VTTAEDNAVVHKVGWTMTERAQFVLAAVLLASVIAFAQAPMASSSGGQPIATSKASDFPLGTATPSEECGACHQAIYREFAYGFGADLNFLPMVLQSQKEQRLTMPAQVASGATAHAVAGFDPFPIHARDVEEKGRSCNVCHYPQPFGIPAADTAEMTKPQPRTKEQEAAGLTCASCHLTPEGKIRGPYQVSEAPHETLADERIQSSAMCAYCHSMGKRVVGKQTQTFLEWREDFSKPGLGRQQCQDCHMPRTTRKTAEDFDVPVRTVARHLWTGGHSSQRLGTALSLVIVQPESKNGKVEFHVINIGAGHSVPTGSNRRGMYLRAEAKDSAGKIRARNEWLFAPWYGNRPDDRKFLEEDKKREDAVAATQADAQGPHEPSIRAGEERILTWEPQLKPGRYAVRATLIYDLNRYNDPSFTEDQTTLASRTLDVTVGTEHKSR